MAQIIPPLKLYNYSPQSIAGTSNPTGSQNNSFFNLFNSNYSISTQIAVNTQPSSFNKDAFSHYYNGQTQLYLNNINDILSERIGNVLIKRFTLKLNPKNSINTNNGFFVLYVYDKQNFNYGTILFTTKNNDSLILNANGYYPDGKYTFNIVYADGYYSYLVNDLNSNVNELTAVISNGIRELTIPPNPTGKYDPNSIDKFTYFPAFYFGTFNSTFINNSVIPIQDYNVYTNLNLQSSLNSDTISGNTLFQGCITDNLIFNENYDVLYFNCFSVQKRFSLSLSGNILGLFVNSNQTLTNTGAFNNINGTKAVIIYADGDFEYLNEITFPYTYKFTTDPSTNSVAVNLPVKPDNYQPPVLIKLPNQIQGGILTWNDFYVGKFNNSIIYDSTIEVQAFTLATTDVYDSYDYDNNISGQVIGNAVSYTCVNKTSISTQLHLNFTQYNFNNGTTLLTCYVSTVSLNKVGGLPNGFIIFPNVFSSSDNYIQNGNILYNIQLTTRANADRVQTQTILPII